ncbi:MAG: o-succinylbenzoate synthase [Thermoplasmata archaeon]|jgi:O-succinylbenzoate synthase|nr:o-succinylbenzoate synthase [Thermoplasmatales archaeon]PMP73237.1 MAG: o-succinylbenzoate synthase [Aciduliprofundum sp.]HEU12624.1 o-succinylbenzoate synthase [Euryarchaeota archaeon]
MAEIIVYNMKIPLKVPFETSFGVQNVRDVLLFRYSGDVEAWGESVTDSYPGYSYEDNGTALYIFRTYLLEILKETEDPMEFISRARKIKGHNMAKSAVETMLWDLQAKRKGKSLKEIIGGSKEKIDSGISIGILPMEKLLSMIRNSLDRGYKRIKLKVKPGWDVDVVKRVREEFGDIPLTVDANQAFEKNVERVKMLDRYELLMIEQPLNERNLLGHSKLQREMSTPICLDESIHSVEDAERMYEMDAGRIINLKIGRVGGLSESLRIIDFSRENGIPIWCGGMLETGIGRALNVIVQSRKEFTLPGDTSPSDRYFEKDVIKRPFIMEKGTIAVPSGNGIGVEPDIEFIEKSSYSRYAFRIG